GTGQLCERRNLLAETGVDIAGPRRKGRPEGSSGGITNHWRQLGIAGLDAGVHVAGGPRPEVEQLDDVADRRGVELAEQFQVGRGDSADGWHESLHLATLSDASKKRLCVARFC